MPTTAYTPRRERSGRTLSVEQRASFRRAKGTGVRLAICYLRPCSSRHAATFPRQTFFACSILQWSSLDRPRRSYAYALLCGLGPVGALRFDSHPCQSRCWVPSQGKDCCSVSPASSLPSVIRLSRSSTASGRYRAKSARVICRSSSEANPSIRAASARSWARPD